MTMENRELSTSDLAYGRREEPTAEQKTAGGQTTAASEMEGATALLDGGLAGNYRERWTDIQGRFVDEPQESVKQADSLVADVIQQLAQRFAQERSTLEDQWQRGSEVSTEDLRQALQHYRSFFQRLLAA